MTTGSTTGAIGHEYSRAVMRGGGRCVACLEHGWHQDVAGLHVIPRRCAARDFASAPARFRIAMDGGPEGRNDWTHTDQANFMDLRADAGSERHWHVRRSR